MLPKAYDPKGVEDRIYAMWEKSGAFRADRNSGKETFTISMPPPNATGSLHLGNSLMIALEDIFIRFQRMRGKEALWVPGTDHAAIATENVVIRELKKNGMKDPRKELGREKLVEEIKKYVAQSRDTIRSQIRKMGASCDWSRERYTMDDALNRCVNEVFVKMYTNDLIYRGHRIVNWDPKLQTNVSDDEVEWQTQKDPFYTFQYGPFQIGTVRPETKFGDKYVVMHPDDKRYTSYKHGNTFECEWINGPITATIIKDEAVDPEFGSGCMTITPWHTQVDYDIAERHGLDKEQIIDFDGNLLPIAGEFDGMPIEKAREKIVHKLDKKGLLVKTEDNYEHTVATNSRGGGTIEPQVKLQWFVNVNKKAVFWKGKTMSLKEVMQDVVHSGDIEIIPERFKKIYFHWIDNLRDWCISRQIWWGHRIPVWYRGDEEYSGVTPPEGEGPAFAPDGATAGKWEKDPDTLDTWFSSGLWTWSTLVDPEIAKDFSLTLKEILEKSPDFRHFHPTQVLETGYDIIFFWVARMILLTTYAVGQIPFETVYLHGLIRTRDGAKMSKSLPEGNIDPLDIIPKYGADALRLSMIVGQSPGNDSKLFEEKIAGYRNFVNKLWNASRFVLMQCQEAGVDVHATGLDREALSLADRAVLSELQSLIEDTSEGLEHYRLSEVGERLYSFTWDFFCDWYLELSKGSFNAPVALHVLRTLLHLLHPYCPFVTEELWDAIKPADSDMLMKQGWPTVIKELQDDEATEQLQIIVEVISAIRQLRSEYTIESSKKIAVVLVGALRHGSGQASHAVPLLKEQESHIRRLARVESLTVQGEKFEGENAASAFTKHVEVHIPLEGVIDVAKEKERLTKEKDQLSRFLKGVQGKLQNKAFVKNAPEEVISKEEQKAEDAKGKLKKVEEKLARLR